MRRDLVTVWELRISLHVAVTDRSLADLRDRVRGAMDDEVAGSVVPSAFIWNTRGALVTVRTEGDPSRLMEIATWALMNTAPEPTEFVLKSMRTAPLARTEGWQGYVRD